MVPILALVLEVVRRRLKLDRAPEPEAPAPIEKEVSAPMPPLPPQHPMVMAQMPATADGQLALAKRLVEEIDASRLELRNELAEMRRELADAKVQNERLEREVERLRRREQEQSAQMTWLHQVLAKLGGPPPPQAPGP